MLHSISGDLTTLSGNFIIVQQVNCQNVMGAGLAKSLMTRWPQIASDYHAYCYGKSDAELLGHVQTTVLGEQQFVCNVFGQRFYGRHGHFTNEDKLLSAVKVIIKHAASANLPVYIPANLGSGLAGGDKNRIVAGIKAFTEQYDADVYLVDYAKRNL